MEGGDDGDVRAPGAGERREGEPERELEVDDVGTVERRLERRPARERHVEAARTHRTDGKLEAGEDAPCRLLLTAGGHHDDIVPVAQRFHEADRRARAAGDRAVEGVRHEGDAQRIADLRPRHGPHAAS